MKPFYPRIVAAVLAAVTISGVPVSAEYTNTAGDWMYRTEWSLDDIGAEFYHTISAEAAKGVDGWLGNVELGEDISELISEGARGIKVYTYNGTASYTPSSSQSASMALTENSLSVKDAVERATSVRCNDVVSEINRLYAAFKKDHPECFWLSGRSYCIYVIDYTYSANGSIKYTIDYYLVLKCTRADGTAFDIRYDEYRDLALLTNDIARRDKAIEDILSSDSVTKADSTAAKAEAISVELTMRNAYHSSDKTAGHMSHESLSALVGSIGDKGPVCEGYAKAYKVLCDNAGITCVTIDGNSVNSIKKKGEHTWNAVMINGLWYGVDVTFCDPMTGSSDKAVSGYENTDYVLVGKETVISKKKFSETHIPDMKLTTTEDTVVAAPEIYTYSYEKTPYEAISTPFTDMNDYNIFYGEIKYCWDLRRMIGVTDTLFAEDVNLTRGMIVTILWRREGSPKVVLDKPFSDVPDDMWFTEAIAWAQTEDIVKGYGDGTYGPYDTLTREQTFKILQRYAYYKGYDATVRTKYPSLSGYEYSDWAESAAVFARHFRLTDREQNLAGTARREEIAAYIRRFDAAFGKGNN